MPVMVVLSLINVNLMSAFAPHRHGPVIRRGVQLVIEIPAHTSERSYFASDLDETSGLELVAAVRLQAIGASDRNRSSRSAWWIQKLPLMVPLLAAAFCSKGPLYFNTNTY
jgi:hypothetical protein